MSILKSIGVVANGWAKFIVALVALGWFGAYGINELRSSVPEGGDSTMALIQKYDEDLSSIPGNGEPNSSSVGASSQSRNEAASTSDIALAADASPSVFGSLGSELSSALAVLFGNKTIQFTLATLAGAGLGLASRPLLTSYNRHRRILAAKKRQLLLEEDRQLLAIAAGTTPSASILASQASSSDAIAVLASKI